MKRQNYFPRLQAEQPEWFNNIGDKMGSYTVALGLDPLVVADRVKDARYCAYTVGVWLAQVRTHSAAGTAAVSVLYYGSTAGAYALPVFTPPAMPAGTVPVPAGALDRLVRFVQDIKNAAGYTEAIGQDLGIIGAAAPAPPDVPTFDIAMLMGGACQCVRLDFQKDGYMGVLIEGRRGPNGDWETLGIDTQTPYLDERPLLVAGVPEVREYRMRFWDEGAPTGDWTPVQKTTVSPS